MARSLRKTYWVYATLWTALIYSTLYIVRPICEFLKRTIPFALFMDLLIIFLLVLTVGYLWAHVKIRKPSTYVLILVVLGLYGYGLMMISFPSEKIHFAEYGFLSYLIYRALRYDLKKTSSFILSFVLTALVGWGDEGIQYFLPNRYYDINDVILNSMSGALGLFLTFILEREKGFS